MEWGGIGGGVYTMKKRIQRYKGRKLLRWRTKSEKWYKLQSELFFLFEIHIIRYFFIYVGNFQVPPERNHPTQSANFYPKSQFDLRPYYINLLKIAQSPLHNPGGMQIMKSLWICQCIFLILIKLL